MQPDPTFFLLGRRGVDEVGGLGLVIGNRALETTGRREQTGRRQIPAVRAAGAGPAHLVPLDDVLELTGLFLVDVW